MFWKETFVLEPRLSPFLKLAAYFRHLKMSNGILEFCSGEISGARRIGDRRRDGISTCLISRAPWKALFRICHSRRQNDLISHSQSKFAPAMRTLVSVGN